MVNCAGVISPILAMVQESFILFEMVQESFLLFEMVQEPFLFYEMVQESFLLHEMVQEPFLLYEMVQKSFPLFEMVQEPFLLYEMVQESFLLTSTESCFRLRPIGSRRSELLSWRTKLGTCTQKSQVFIQTLQNIISQNVFCILRMLKKVFLSLHLGK